MKYAIILTAETLFDDFKRLDELAINHNEVIIVVDKFIGKEKEVLEKYPNIKLVVSGKIADERKRCMARYALSSETDYMVFLGEHEFNKKWLEFLTAEPLIAAVGRADNTDDEFTKKTILHKLLPLVQYTEEEFEKLCCDDKGAIKRLEESPLYVSTKTWDLVGGLNVESETPYTEYCVRLQLLGYTILPMNNE